MSINLFKRFEAVTELENAERLLFSLVETSCINFDLDPNSDGERTLFELWQCEPYASHCVFSTLPTLGEIESALKLLSEFSERPVQSAKKSAEIRRRSELFPGGYTEKQLLELGAAVREALSLAESYGALAEESARLESELERLLPWEGYGEPLCFEGTEHTFFCLGSIPVKYDIDDIILELNGYAATLQPISFDDALYYVRLITHKESRDEVLAFLEKYEFSIYEYKVLDDTARSILGADRRRLLTVEGERIRIEERLTYLAECRDRLGALYDIIATRALCLELSRGIQISETCAYISGTLPTFCVESVGKIFESFGSAYEFSEPDEGFFIAKNGKFAKKYEDELLKYVKTQTRASQRLLYSQSGREFVPTFPSEVYTKA